MIVLIVIQIVVTRTIILVTSHQFNVVLTKEVFPVHALLEVIGPHTLVLLYYLTVQVGILTKVWVGCISITPFTKIDAIDRSYCESIGQAKINRSSTIEGITLCILFIQLIRRNRVRLAQIRTNQTHRGTITIVITIQLRILVIDNLTIGITNIDRIDRSNIT